MTYFTGALSYICRQALKAAGCQILHSDYVSSDGSHTYVLRYWDKEYLFTLSPVSSTKVVEKTVEQMLKEEVEDVIKLPTKNRVRDHL